MVSEPTPVASFSHGEPRTVTVIVNTVDVPPAVTLAVIVFVAALGHTPSISSVQLFVPPAPAVTDPGAPVEAHVHAAALDGAAIVKAAGMPATTVLLTAVALADVGLVGRAWAVAVAMRLSAPTAAADAAAMMSLRICATLSLGAPVAYKSRVFRPAQQKQRKPRQY